MRPVSSLVGRVSLAGLLGGSAACRHEPPRDHESSIVAPVEPTSPARSTKTDRHGLARSCDETTPCDEGLECRRLCREGIGEHVPDECEPTAIAFCDRAASKRALTPEELMLVLPGPELRGVVGRIADPSHLVDPETRALAVTDTTLVVGRRAPAELVPDAVRALVGHRFVVMGATQAVCEAELTGFSIVGLEPREGSSTAPKVGAKVDESVYAYARGHGAVYLAATLRATQGCAGAVWARDAMQPEVSPASAREVTEPERRSALARYRELAPYRAHLERLRIATGDPIASDWTTVRDGGGFGPETTGFELAGHPHLVVSTAVGEVCVGYTSALMVSFHADDDALRVGAFSWALALRPRVALDLDGDGELELIEHDGARARLWSATLETAGDFATAPATSGC